MTNTTIHGTQSRGEGSRVEETVHRARVAGENTVDTAARYAKDKLAGAEELAHDAEGKLRSVARDAADVTKHAIEHHPYLMLGAAAGLGFILGLLVRR